MQKLKLKIIHVQVFTLYNVSYMNGYMILTGPPIVVVMLIIWSKNGRGMNIAKRVCSLYRLVWPPPLPDVLISLMPLAYYLLLTYGRHLLWLFLCQFSFWWAQTMVDPDKLWQIIVRAEQHSNIVVIHLLPLLLLSFNFNVNVIAATFSTPQQIISLELELEDVIRPFFDCCLCVPLITALIPAHSRKWRSKIAQTRVDLCLFMLI